jgi:CxxC motif-containing protein (DUF1111 family)
MALANLRFVRGWRLAGIAGMMLGATALTGTAFAQFIPNRGGGGFPSGPGGGGAFPGGPGFPGGGGGPRSPGGGGGGAPSGQQPTDPGVRGGEPGAGGVLQGLNNEEKAFWFASVPIFAESDGVEEGLGPRFNLDGCGGCHSQPALGGSSPATNPQVAVATAMGARNRVPSFITADGPIREARFVRNPNGTPDGGVHSLFVIAGRSDAQGCNIQQEDFEAQVRANNVIFRIPTPTFGTGLMELVPDSNLRAAVAANAQQKRALGISGRFNTSDNDGTIARFGWKAQNKSLLLFSGEAYNVEMGVTNDLFPQERDENPSCQLNGVPESTTIMVPEEQSQSRAADFSQDIVMFAAFMRLLDPPTPATATPAAASATTPAASTAVAAADPATAVSVLPAAAASAAASTSTGSTSGGSASPARGQQVFNNIGCVACHIENQTTGKSSFTGQSNKPFQPFSDLAIHDMGAGLADGVTQGRASGREFRTAPLWGVGQRIFFHHDGRDKDLVAAIRTHSSAGSEANAVIQNYNMLSLNDKQALINFLRSL